MGTNPSALDKPHQVVDYSGLALKVSEIQNETGQVLVDGEAVRPPTIADLAVTDTSLTVTDPSLTVTDTNLSITDIDTLAGFLKVVQVSVDCSAGGTAQETAIATIPAWSQILNVTARVTTAFDGSGTTTFEVGTTANPDIYIDQADFDPSVLNTIRNQFESTTSDVDEHNSIGSSSSAIVATWTNSGGSPSAGAVQVTIVYLDMQDFDLAGAIATAFTQIETAINTNIAASFAEVETQINTNLAAAFAEVETAINTNIAASFAEVETKVNAILDQLETAGIFSDA